MGRARRNSGLGGCGNIPRIARHRHEVCIPVDGAKYKLDTLGAPKREIVKLGIVKIKTAEQLTNLEVRMSKSSPISSADKGTGKFWGTRSAAFPT